RSTAAPGRGAADAGSSRPGPGPSRSATAPEKPSLEVVVSVTNINYNKGSEILHTCKPLKEYTLFVDAVRRHTKLDSENGFRNAIKECIQNDILREYLQRKSKEVMNMLIAEYDYDVDIAVQKEEALQEGSYQKALETARLMKQANCKLDFIMQITGLPLSEIEKL
ncbi:MAG: hypothetical protein ACFNMA_04805, partial [Treponema socranskii subsp. buccale]